MDPSRIGGYDIVGELGRGAMGVVYKAHDPAIQRPVAIKVIRVNLGDSPEESTRLRQRLIREASAAGKLNHPGIVIVYQLGEEGDNVFVVMEFVEGASLEHLLINNPGLDRAWSLDMLRQIADALDFAHRNHVVHRDIKPANILVGANGRVKVADFGIAKITAGATTGMTGTGISLGSPAYMSPEQVQAIQIDGRSDQFALGTIAFQMLTGRMPFRGDTAHTVMYQIVTADPFEALPTDLPLAPAVRTVLARALAKNPRDRFPDCSSFIQELTSIVGVTAPASQTSTARMEPVPAPAPAPIPVLATTKESKTWLLFTMLGVFVMLLILGGGIYWYTHETESSTAAEKPAEHPLIKAIGEGNTDEAAKLISPATVNAADANGMTPLLAAITYGKVEIAKLLIAKGANINGTNREGITPLMVAAEGTAYLPNNLPLLQLVLAANPNIDAQDNSGRTALDHATGDGKIDSVRILLDQGAKIEAKTNQGATALFHAVEYGKVPILRLLIERHAQVDVPDANGDTPLMIAAEGNAYLANNAPMVEALLAAGAQVDAVDAHGRTPLYRASAEGKEDAMRLLLDHKANVNQRADDRSTPLMQAVTYFKLAAAQLLIDRGADVNLPKTNDVTPLMVAAETSPYIKNPAVLIKLLLDHNANKAAVDSQGRTALQIATESKNEAAALLLK